MFVENKFVQFLGKIVEKNPLSIVEKKIILPGFNVNCRKNFFFVLGPKQTPSIKYNDVAFTLTVALVCLSST